MDWIGTAGWGIPKAAAGRFPAGGTGLQRYAAVFPAVEINSSFYRSHRRQTYERWAASTPPGFRFAVKAPRALTHDQRLRDPGGGPARLPGPGGGASAKSSAPSSSSSRPAWPSTPWRPGSWTPGKAPP